MNREEKAAVIDEVAEQIRGSEAIFAVDYRGLSVKEAAELRTRLVEAGATFRVIKNRLTIRAADAAGAESLKELLEGPTAFTFVPEGGDAALAAKALAQFRRETDTLAFKGGRMGADALTVEQIESISRLPARDMLNGQFVGVLASPLTTLVRGLASLISGIAVQLQQIQEQGLVGGAAAEPETAEEAAGEAPAGEESAGEESAGEAPAVQAAAEGPAAEEAPEAVQEASAEQGERGEDATPTPQGDTLAEATSQESTDTPSEGEQTE